MKINLIEYLEETVKEKANKCAIIDNDRSIAIGNLVNQAKVIAMDLINEKNIIKKPIAVFLNKSIESISSDLGIIYSGNFYSNLDIKTPAERIKNILELIKPEMIITNNKYLKLIAHVIPEYVQIFNLDDKSFDSQIDDKKIFSRLESLIDTDPVCVINTSGSTGTPKGVVLNHRSFIDFTEWALNKFKFSDSEVIGSLSPLVFDIYSFELCLLMSKGSTIVIIPDQLSAYPAAILKILQDNHVTFIFWVPTIMVNIANLSLLDKVKLPDLKKVWFAGEVFPTKQFNYWKTKLIHTLFVNLYGPIEITLDCTYYIIDRNIQDDEPIPIGFPCRNTDIIILDINNNKVTEHNKEGELCVRGTSLALGYYNNSKKTAEAFIQNPLNTSYPEIIYKTGDIVFINGRDEIVFKGRKDSLIKHMGYRIELGEVEHVIINKLKLVQNGCVVYDFLKKEIILFYEAENEFPSSEFRKIICKELPKYMIPTVYIRLDELQRNTNGKIDRLYYKTQVNGKN